ncbi:class I SAM-dependent methyltransferase [Vibrio sinaloensis]|uniref:class I SAM-dependent methyltransferase n=1 Tax=Photobacterium sp. (strain ATCC 43367) TaxID=379097 RepID=UPI00057C99EA|nr:class I SAM-dependent methyltransferase [Vibrio sinaloensis]KHT51538.1 methyltransferase type 11 [Vibrio sinaloensis]
MKPSEVGLAYDQITHRWQSDSFDLSNGIDAHKKALTFLSHSSTGLDVGCGCTGRIIELMQASGLTPEGLDISSEMIRLSRIKYPSVQFHHADICQFEFTKTYDFISAWDSLWHIPLSSQRYVMTKLVNALNPGGVLLFSFGGTQDAGEHDNKVMGPKMYYSTLGTDGFLRLFMELGCVIRHLEFDQYPEQHTFLIIQKADKPAP